MEQLRRPGLQQGWRAGGLLVEPDDDRLAGLAACPNEHKLPSGVGCRIVLCVHGRDPAALHGYCEEAKANLGVTTHVRKCVPAASVWAIVAISPTGVASAVGAVCWLRQCTKLRGPVRHRHRASDPLASALCLGPVALVVVLREFATTKPTTGPQGFLLPLNRIVQNQARTTSSSPPPSCMLVLPPPVYQARVIPPIATVVASLRTIYTILQLLHILQTTDVYASAMVGMCTWCTWYYSTPRMHIQ